MLVLALLLFVQGFEAGINNRTKYVNGVWEIMVPPRLACAALAHLEFDQAKMWTTPSFMVQFGAWDVMQGSVDSTGTFNAAMLTSSGTCSMATTLQGELWNLEPGNASWSGLLSFEFDQGCSCESSSFNIKARHRLSIDAGSPDVRAPRTLELPMDAPRHVQGLLGEWDVEPPLQLICGNTVVSQYRKVDVRPSFKWPVINLAVGPHLLSGTYLAASASTSLSTTSPTLWESFTAHQRIFVPHFMSNSSSSPLALEPCSIEVSLMARAEFSWRRPSGSMGTEPSAEEEGGGGAARWLEFEERGSLLNVSWRAMVNMSFAPRCRCRASDDPFPPAPTIQNVSAVSRLRSLPIREPSDLVPSIHPAWSLPGLDPWLSIYIAFGVSLMLLCIVCGSLACCVLWVRHRRGTSVGRFEHSLTSVFRARRESRDEDGGWRYGDEDSDGDWLEAPNPNRVPTLFAVQSDEEQEDDDNDEKLVLDHAYLDDAEHRHPGHANTAMLDALDPRDKREVAKELGGRTALLDEGGGERGKRGGGLAARGRSSSTASTDLAGGKLSGKLRGNFGKLGRVREEVSPTPTSAFLSPDTNVAPATLSSTVAPLDNPNPLRRDDRVVVIEQGGSDDDDDGDGDDGFDDDDDADEDFDEDADDVDDDGDGDDDDDSSGDDDGDGGDTDHANDNDQRLGGDATGDGVGKEHGAHKGSLEILTGGSFPTAKLFRPLHSRRKRQTGNGGKRLKARVVGVMGGGLAAETSRERMTGDSLAEVFREASESASARESMGDEGRDEGDEPSEQQSQTETETETQLDSPLELPAIDAQSRLRDVSGDDEEAMQREQLVGGQETGKEQDNPDNPVEKPDTPVEHPDNPDQSDNLDNAAGKAENVDVDHPDARRALLDVARSKSRGRRGRHLSISPTRRRSKSARRPTKLD